MILASLTINQLMGFQNIMLEYYMISFLILGLNKNLLRLETRLLLLIMMANLILFFRFSSRLNYLIGLLILILVVFLVLIVGHSILEFIMILRKILSLVLRLIAITLQSLLGLLLTLKIWNELFN